jgi:predicted DNA-binding transcriptional regulator AlpA
MVPGITLDMLDHLRKARKGPAYRKPTPRTVVYRESDVVAWVESTKVQTRDQPGN